MTITAALLVCLAVKVIYAVEMECRNTINCPCGSTGRNIRVCVPDSSTHAEACSRLSKCARCEEGSNVCSKCPEGLEGPFCSQDVNEPILKRQERQSSGRRSRPRTSEKVKEKPPHCENPGPISHGRMQVKNQRRSQRPGPDYDQDEYPEDTILEYTCEEGFYMQGQRSLTCKSGVWSAETPSCVRDCGRSFMQTFQRILNGTMTISGDWPWVVSISVDGLGGSASAFICGGAVLNPHTIITAAHCLRNNFVEGKQFILRFGKHLFSVYEDDTEVLVRRTSQVIIHKNYSNKTLDSDIALMKFQPRIRYSYRVQPICLPTRASTGRNIKPGSMGYVGGWGMTEEETEPNMMLMATLPVVRDQDCMNAYKEQKLVLTSNMFCAGYEDRRQSVCGGDSGSPLVFYDKKSERYTLEGLVSFGVRGQCGVAGKYAIFTKVFRFKSWIIRHARS